MKTKIQLNNLISTVQKPKRVILIALALTVIIGSILIVKHKPRPVKIARLPYAHYALFDPSGEYVITTEGGFDGRKATPAAVIWDMKTRKRISALDSPWTTEKAVFGPNETYMVTMTRDSHLQVWDSATWELINEIKAPGLLCDIEHHPTQELLAISTCHPIGGSTTLINPRTGHEVAVLAEWPPDGGYDLAFSPDGELLAASGGSKDPLVIKIWRVADLTLVREFTQPGSAIDLTWSPDGLYLATGGINSQLHIWNMETGQPLLLTLPKPSPANFGDDPAWWDSNSQVVRSVTFSPDGRFFLAGGDNQPTTMWDTSTWEQVARFGRDDVQSIVFSPDNYRVVITSHVDYRYEEKSTIAWDLSDYWDD